MILRAGLYLLRIRKYASLFPLWHNLVCMVSLLSALFIGILCLLSSPENGEVMPLNTGKQESPETIGDMLGNENNIYYRRFVSEHQMWCTPGPEVSLALKTNLLYWLAATPNAGLELFWRRRWSLSIEGTYASWLYNRATKYYYLAVISPEFRYWLRRDGRFNGHHFGAGIQIGQYDMQFGRTGEQADFAGFSLAYGYALPVTRVMNIEFGLAIGCIIRDYIRYETLNNEYVRTGDGRKAWIGPTRIDISCVWHIANKKRGKR